MAKTFIDKRTLADRLSVSPRTVQRWSAEGKIPFYKFSETCIRFDPDEVEKHLLKSRVEPVTI